MANEAVYIALVALVIIITVIIWNRKVDNYSLISKCQMKCNTLVGEGERNLCVQKCLGHQVIRYGGQKCTRHDQCGSQQSCILKGYYTGESGNVFPMPNEGHCMDNNDPGVVNWKQISDNHSYLPDDSDYPDDPTDPTNPYSQYQYKKLAPLLGTQKGDCMARCMSDGTGDLSTCQNLCGLPDYNLKGPTVDCAMRCMSERGNPAECKSLCGLPNPPSACMRKCKS